MKYDRVQFNKKLASIIKELVTERRLHPEKNEIYTRQINSLREATEKPQLYATLIREIMEKGNGDGA